MIFSGLIYYQNDEVAQSSYARFAENGGELNLMKKILMIVKDHILPKAISFFTHKS